MRIKWYGCARAGLADVPIVKPSKSESAGVDSQGVCSTSSSATHFRIPSGSGRGAYLSGTLADRRHIHGFRRFVIAGFTCLEDES